METALVSQRLPKTCLIRKGWEYQEVYSGGKRLHGKGFSLILLSNSSLESRLGISIHRKLRGAVKRNRIKRIIRESFRVERKHYPQGMNIVFAVRPDFDLKNPDEITQAVINRTAGLNSCRTP
jgi:ribonuclease P protein component